MGEVRRVRDGGRAPKISALIPSLDGVRGGNVQRLIEDLERQTVRSVEVILSIGFKPNGHARNQGARAALGEFLVSIDDDVRLGHERVLEQLLRPFAELPNIGMTGAAQLIPPESNRFQRRAAREISRSMCTVVHQVTDTDFVSHMCLCIPLQLFKDVGWESDTLVRGTDPDLRRRVRAAGKRIVLAPDCWAYHPMPATLTKLIRVAWRNGVGSAWVAADSPEMCLDTPDRHASGAPVLHSRTYRGGRFVARVLRRLLTLQYVGLSSDVVYGLAYTYGSLTGASGTD